MEIESGCGYFCDQPKPNQRRTQTITTSDNRWLLNVPGMHVLIRIKRLASQPLVGAGVRKVLTTLGLDGGLAEDPQQLDGRLGRGLGAVPLGLELFEDGLHVSHGGLLSFVYCSRGVISNADGL